MTKLELSANNHWKLKSSKCSLCNIKYLRVSSPCRKVLGEHTKTDEETRRTPPISLILRLLFNNYPQE